MAKSFKLITFFQLKVTFGEKMQNYYGGLKLVSIVTQLDKYVADVIYVKEVKTILQSEGNVEEVRKIIVSNTIQTLISNYNNLYFYSYNILQLTLE